MMESRNLKDLVLSSEESRDIIKFLARKQMLVIMNIWQMKSYCLP